MLKSNFYEESLCDYITDLEKKLNRAKSHIDKSILAGKISDAKKNLSQALGTESRHNVHFDSEPSDYLFSNLGA